MIYIDNRTGSKELHHLFPKGSAELTHLEYADFMFTGHYDDGDILVGIERKRIGDFVNCMCSGRFSGRQLIGMLNSYHYLYLIIEGKFRAHPRTGILQLKAKDKEFWYNFKAGKRRFMARDIWAFMNTMQVVCGLHCYHCPTESDTVHYIRALYHWWTKEYGEHRGHLQPHTGTMVDLSKQTTLRRVLLQLDGPGWEMSKALDQKFDSVYAMMCAPIGVIADTVYGKEGKKNKRIGDKTAEAIIKQLHGGK